MSHYRRLLGSLIASVLAGFLALPAASADSPQAPPQPAKAIEKSRDPSGYHTLDRSAQITLGGAKYEVVGPLQRIEGNYFYVRDEESGETVRLVIDEGTRAVCTMQTAGPGGECVFKPGDRVQAEVSDLGTVLLIRPRPPQDNPELRRTMRQYGDILSLASPPTGEYVVLPAPFGSLREVEPAAPTPVKGPDGRILGSLHKVIYDRGSDRLAYAIVRLADSDLLVPVPWADLAVSQQDGDFVLLNRHYQLEPAISPKEAVDRSPKLQELYRIVRDLQEQIPPDLRADAGSGANRGSNRDRQIQARNANCPDARTMRGDVIRGEVVDVQDNFLIVKDPSSRLIHVHRDQCTQQASQRIRTGLFLPGDTIEAYVTPKGHAISLSMLRPAAYGHFPDN